jgi:hypothetical protein
MNRLLLPAAVALAFGLSATSAFADATADRKGAAAHENSTAFVVDIDAAVAVSDLDGIVAGNAVILAANVLSSNTVEKGAFTRASGIIQVGQNTGANSLVQQNNTVQANMDFSSKP